MKRITFMIVAVLAAFTFIAGMNTSASSSPTPITSKFYAPSDVEVHDNGCDSISISVDAPSHSNFMVFKVSTHKDMHDAFYLRPGDEPLADAVDNEDATFEGLNSDDTYYLEAAAADLNGHRLSPYSTKVGERTDASC